MRVMVILKSDQNGDKEMQPTPEMKEAWEAMGKYNAELVKAGVFLQAEGLLPTSKGKRVRFSGNERTVLDGPFIESKEIVAGFWIWQVKSMEEAVEWLKRAPFERGTEVEIRQVGELSEVSPDILAPEEASRRQAVKDEIRQKSAKP